MTQAYELHTLIDRRQMSLKESTAVCRIKPEVMPLIRRRLLSVIHWVDDPL